MSMSILVTGTFKNGKKRLAGFHSPYNKVIEKEDLKNMVYFLESDIYPVIEKFSKITVSCNMSYNTLLRPGIDKTVEVWGKPDIQDTIKRYIIEMNRAFKNT